MTMRRESFSKLTWLTLIVLVAGFERGFAQAPNVALRAMRAKQLSQQNGNFVVMPQNLPASRRTGLWLYVDTRWVNGYGYRPVEVTICAPGPLTANHSITVQLHCG